MSPGERAELEALTRKYRTLARLRADREEAIAKGWERFPEPEATARRRDMHLLATEFPGALRELDASRPGEFEERIAALERALRDDAPEAWMFAAAAFHLALREALQIRANRLAEGRWWTAGRLTPAELQRLRHPPNGRVLDVVWESVAAALGCTPREAELLVYPRAPKRGVRS